MINLNEASNYRIKNRLKEFITNNLSNTSIRNYISKYCFKYYYKTNLQNQSNFYSIFNYSDYSFNLNSISDFMNQPTESSM